MAKVQDPEEFLTGCGVQLEHECCGELFNRPLLFNSDTGMLFVGEAKSTFDKFGNSTELTFDIRLAKGQRQFTRWFDEIRASKKRVKI